MTSTAYHSTTPATQKELSEYEQVALKQNEQILQFLREHYPDTYTAEQLSSALPAPMLTTSIRRALTNLNREMKINRVGYKTGIFGRRIGVYQAVV